MKCGDAQFEDAMRVFESNLKRITGGRTDKEDRSFWKSGNVYQDGRVNEYWQFFLAGADYGARFLSNE